MIHLVDLPSLRSLNAETQSGLTVTLHSVSRRRQSSICDVDDTLRMPVRWSISECSIVVLENSAPCLDILRQMQSFVVVAVSTVRSLAHIQPYAVAYRARFKMGLSCSERRKNGGFLSWWCCRGSRGPAMQWRGTTLKNRVCDRRGHITEGINKARRVIRVRRQSH